MREYKLNAQQLFWFICFTNKRMVWPGYVSTQLHAYIQLHYFYRCKTYFSRCFLKNELITPLLFQLGVRANKGFCRETLQCCRSQTKSETQTAATKPASWWCASFFLLLFGQWASDVKDSVSSLLQTLMVSVLCVVQVAVYSPPQSEPPTVVNKMALKCSVPSNCPGFTQRRKANIFKVIHLSLESDLSFLRSWM